MDIHDQAAIVTGASRGIGEAIARRLAGLGAKTILAGRDTARLELVCHEIVRVGGNAIQERLDLADAGSIDAFSSRMGSRLSGLRVLVNCGGLYSRGSWEETTQTELRALFETNVIGAFALTRALLPMLIEARGDLVFVNSTIIASDGKESGAYAASQHALRGLTNALRAEINEVSVRVLSVFPGRTATPRQERIHRVEGKAYRPERLLQPADVAKAIAACLLLPDTAEVTELRIRPRYK